MTKGHLMQGTNPTEFEKWCADEIGLTEAYVKSKRKINILGMLQYRNVEIEKRFMAYKAGLISGASIGCESAKVHGTNWVKCSDKMPEEARPVLLKIKWDKELAIGFFINNQFHEQAFFSEVVGDARLCTKISGVLITHWMYVDSIPLPLMPEGE